MSEVREAIRVLLVDDHALFRAGLASLLQTQKDCEVVGEAGNGEEALEKAKELMPDVILMDVYMPKMGGPEACRRIREALPYVKIVMLTVSEDDKDLFEAIKAGAHGYMLKKLEPHVLFKMLRGTMRGEAPISRMAASKILGEFARLARHGSEEASAHENLSAREHEVLGFLTKGATNKEIASSLGIAENTVKNHVKNILEKLHLQNRVQAAAYALRKDITHPRKPEA